MKKPKRSDASQPWTVLFHPDCNAWFLAQELRVQNRILAVLGLLRARGPMLGRPHVDSIAGSKIANLKELRIQIEGAPWRILFAFDASRSAILLVGGNKGGDARWYETNIPVAEARARDHGL